jgi:hypothetical protein
MFDTRDLAKTGNVISSSIFQKELESEYTKSALYAYMFISTHIYIYMDILQRLINYEQFLYKSSGSLIMNSFYSIRLQGSLGPGQPGRPSPPDPVFLIFY